jgi:hypothetical protein
MVNAEFMDRVSALNILGLNDTKHSPEELRKAYRKACLKTHPDKSHGNEDDFIQITEAYNYLISIPQDDTQFINDHTLVNFLIRLTQFILLKTRQRQIHLTTTIDDIYRGEIKKITYSRMIKNTQTGTLDTVCETLYLELVGFEHEYLVPQKGDFGTNLHIQIDVLNHPIYRIDDFGEEYELHAHVLISVYEYYYGIQDPLQLPDGSILVTEHVPYRDSLTQIVSNKGLLIDESLRGNLYIVYEVDMTKNMPSLELDIVREQFASLFG